MSLRLTPDEDRAQNMLGHRSRKSKTSFILGSCAPFDHAVLLVLNLQAIVLDFTLLEADAASRAQAVLQASGASVKSEHETQRPLAPRPHR